MPHVQTKLDSDTYKEVKKDAIDKDVTMADYVKEAVVAHLQRGKGEKAEAEDKESVDETKLKSKGD